MISVISAVVSPASSCKLGPSVSLAIASLCAFLGSLLVSMTRQRRQSCPHDIFGVVVVVVLYKHISCPPSGIYTAVRPARVLKSSTWNSEICEAIIYNAMPSRPRIAVLFSHCPAVPTPWGTWNCCRLYLWRVFSHFAWSAVIFCRYASRSKFLSSGSVTTAKG